jgi:hypothetical protein
VESTSWSGPKAPAALDAPGDSHRVSVYETARRTFAGTPNSAAALVNAVCRDDGAALAEDPKVARTRLVLARSAATRARVRVTCNMNYSFVVGVTLAPRGYSASSFRAVALARLSCDEASGGQAP